jgi:hypothetical protein
MISTDKGPDGLMDQGRGAIVRYATLDRVGAWACLSADSDGASDFERQCLAVTQLARVVRAHRGLPLPKPTTALAKLQQSALLAQRKALALEARAALVARRMRLKEREALSTQIFLIGTAVFEEMAASPSFAAEMERVLSRRVKSPRDRKRLGLDEVDG